MHCSGNKPLRQFTDGTVYTVHCTTCILMGQCTAGTKYHWDSVPLGQFTAGAGTKYIYRAAANSKMFDV